MELKLGLNQLFDGLNSRVDEVLWTTVKILYCRRLHVNAKASVERCENFLESNRAILGVFAKLVGRANNLSSTQATTSKHST